MKWTIGTKIGAGYALALVILAAIGIVSYRNTVGYVDASQWRYHTDQVLENIADMLSAVKDAETGQRGYVIVGDDSYLAPYRSGTAAADKAIQNIRQLTEDNPSQQRRLDEIELLIAAKLAELKQTIDLRRDQGFQAALPVIQTGKGKNLMDDIRRITTEMGGEEKRLAVQRDNAVNASSRATISTIAYGIPIAFAVLVLVGFLATRTITRQLRESIFRLTSSSTEILATTSQVAASAAETAAAVSETTATVEEVKQTAQLASQKARLVSDSAQRAANVSVTGRKSVGDAIQGMHLIQEQMESIAESIVRLSEQSQAIGEIIASVNGLSEQANLLAVNAAIEASKAGDQGKGFGVVAQEIKSLAEQSRQATSQVRTILGDIQKATGTAVLATERGNKAMEAGVRQAGETGDSIRLLAESISEAAQAAIQIAASSQQQMVGMDQVAMAMENIKQASIQNVAGTRQAEIAAQDLNKLGQKLGQMIGNTSV